MKPMPYQTLTTSILIQQRSTCFTLGLMSLPAVGYSTKISYLNQMMMTQVGKNLLKNEQHFIFLMIECIRGYVIEHFRIGLETLI